MFRTAQIILVAIALFTPGAFSAEVHWALCSPQCPCSSSATVISAGHYGTFHLDSDPLEMKEGSSPCLRGMERLRIYPEPGSDPPVLPCRLDGPGSTPPACFTPIEELRGSTAPWIAVIDWPNWHGAGVSALTRKATDPLIETVLFPLRSRLSSCPGISDVDVLASLAELASELDIQDTRPPLAINMSFGRRHDDDDAWDRFCREDTLSCQIRLLLDYLMRPQANSPPRLMAVAAAGNHRRTLFPAALDNVAAVGSMDLETFRDTGVVKALWETPFDAALTALMPGSALCIDNWPAPPGSSFATALFTGWVSEVILAQPSADVTGFLSAPTWQPWQSCDNCEVRLAHGAPLILTPRGMAAQLVADALYADPARCGQDLADDLITTDMVLVGPDTLDYMSVVNLVADQHRQCPTPSPCVPCSMACEVESRVTSRVDTSAVTKSAPGRRITVGVKAKQRVEVTLTIDLHASWELDPGTELLALFMRIGSELHEVQLPSDDIRHLAQGEIGFLEITGTVPFADLEGQPSMVWILRRDDSDSNTQDVFWSSTPVSLR